MDRNYKNVLYISYDGMTDPLGQSQVIPYIKGLSKYGYKFSLLSCEKKDRYEKNKDLIQSVLDESNIEWHPVTYHKNPPVLSTVFDYQSMKSLAKKLHHQKKFDLVHCRSYISSMLGLYFKQKYNVPFIFDMRGFWADERVDGGLWNLKNPLYNSIYKYFKNQEKLFLENCAAVVSLTEAGKIEMDKWKISVQPKPPVYVIPCSADFELFKPVSQVEKLQNRSKLGIQSDALVVSYLGSIGTWYLLGEMLDQFKEILKYKSSSVFLFVTPDDPEFIKTQAIQRGIPAEKIIVHFAQRKEVRSMVGTSDISLFFIKPTYSKLSSSPTKLGEILAMGIPVICNSGVGDVKEIIEQTKGGVAVDTLTLANYQNVVSHLDELFKLNVESVREKANEYYSLEKAVTNYSNIYRKIFDNIK